MNPDDKIIHDLDEDRKLEIIRIGKKEFDISFIPIGISIPLLSKNQEYMDMLKEESLLKKDGTIDTEKGKRLPLEKVQRNFDMMIDIVSMFTEFKLKECDKKWLGESTDINGLSRAMRLIVESITKHVEKEEDSDSKKK